MKPAIFSARARWDLSEAARWISRDNPVAARALRQAAARAADRIGRHPLIGVARADLLEEPYRFLVLGSFPYVIVYNAARSPPLIMRILHGARDLRNALKDLQWP